MFIYKKNSIDTKFLEDKARQLRIDIVKSIHKAGKGHIGGAYSIVEILTTLYYGNILKFDPKNPLWVDRDRFILSKGHAGIALYAVLADLGYFPSEELDYLNKGRILAEHPDPKIPGIEFVSGSLGHGLSIAAGMALADKLDGKDIRTFVLMGDGECYEGSVWEAAMFASHHQLNNLCAIVDRNGLITNGSTEKFNKLEPFANKWKAFGWEVIEVDGHDFDQLKKVFDKSKALTFKKPLIVLAKTIKGKGVSFMENEAKWHHGGIDDEKLKSAISEIERIN